MKTIGIDQSSFTRSSFENRFMNNIKKIYQYAGKWDDQQNFKDIIDSAIVSTLEGVTNICPNMHLISSPVNKPSSRKSLCLFTNILDVQSKTAKRRFVTAKSRRKSMKLCNGLWTKNQNEKGIQKSMSR